MPYLELLSVALAVSTWGPLMRGLRMVVHSDCETAVLAFEGQAAHSSHLMCLVRDILFLAARHEFALRLEHLPGAQNVFADALSRGQILEFKASYARHNSSPTAVMPLPLQTW